MAPPARRVKNITACRIQGVMKIAWMMISWVARWFWTRLMIQFGVEAPAEMAMDSAFASWPMSSSSSVSMCQAGFPA